MKVKATRAGTHPAGSHWSAGKVRNITLAKGEELPSWLVEVTASKSKASKSKAAPEPKTDEG